MLFQPTGRLKHLNVVSTQCFFLNVVQQGVCTCVFCKLPLNRGADYSCNSNGDVSGTFRPVLKSTNPTFEQLRQVMVMELKTSAPSELASASTLAAKLSKCNENVAQITRFLSYVANRGLKMKDHMKRILRGGQYHFTLTDTACDVKLTCEESTGVRPILDSSEVSAREETSCVYNYFCKVARFAKSGSIGFEFA